MSEYRNDRQVYFSGAFTGSNRPYRIRRLPWYRKLYRMLFRLGAKS